MQKIIFELNGFVFHDFTLFHIGKSEFTLGQLLAIVIGVALLFVISGITNRFIIKRLLNYSHVDVSTRYTIAALVHYSILVIGFIAIMQTAGINLTAFSVLAGAVGVGIGFGLQNIVSNFISGLIVMFERPVRIGDQIELGGIRGEVLKIGARATQIVTAERSVCIMPNQKFITDPVMNWTDHEERSPLVLNVNVDKASDLRQATLLLITAVRQHPSIVKKPATQVWLTSVSGTAAFKVLAWSSGSADERNQVIHELYLAISEILSKQDIKLA
jgi:small-conductance mechanosensitive channel